jgi:hypothetical protein
LGEVFLRDKSPETAQKFLLSNMRKNPNFYCLAIEVLQQLIAAEDVKRSLELLDAVFEIAIQRHDELKLVMMLEKLLQQESMNARILEMLTTLLFRTDDRQKLEIYLKRLLTLELQQENWRAARDTLNKMVVYGQSSLYLDVLQLLNDAMNLEVPEKLQDCGQKVIRILDRGVWEEEELGAVAWAALGVSELDLGMSLGMEPMEHEETQSP